MVHPPKKNNMSPRKRDHLGKFHLNQLFNFQGRTVNASFQWGILLSTKSPTVGPTFHGAPKKT